MSVICGCGTAKTDVLNGVSFAARRGAVLVLLGPNGAGKPNPGK